MINESAVKIGWLGPSLPSSSHIQKFHKLIPAGVEIVYERLILHEGVLNDVRGKLEFIVERAVRFAEAQGLDGLIFPGAPREVLNPGLFAAFSAALKIPVTTALRASAAALRTFGATRVLLLTPFDAALNSGIRDFLTDFGISGVSPSEVLHHYTDALRMTPDDVVAYAGRAMAELRPVDAIYFQGAVLDPMDCLDAMEAELKVPVVASNPAMLWNMLSRLGRKQPVIGHGKLLATWPAPPGKSQNTET
jgi:maleate cis-trans isomerase